MSRSNYNYTYDKKKLYKAIKNYPFEEYVYSIFDKIYTTTKDYRIRTHCPFCEDNKTGHFYVLLSAGLVYCQKCKYDPKWLPQFIADMENVSVNEVVTYLLDGDVFLTDKADLDEILEDLYLQSVEEEDEEYKDYKPLEFDGTFVPVYEKCKVKPLIGQVKQVRDYLINERKLTKQDIIKYKIRYCFSGRYAGRIVIPDYYKGDLVTYVGRKFFPTGLSAKYLAPTDNSQSKFIFNLDRVKGDTIVLTEGAFDAIAVGDMGAATYGKSLSKRQARLLDKFKTKIFYWDKDGYPELERFADMLSGTVKTVLHPLDDDRDAGKRSRAENSALIGSAVRLRSLDYTLYSMEWNRLDMQGKTRLQ